ncbi:BON domain-containing protein [Ideonella oryzae]|uniref:BON domain-containing protein n=1 Tax=Ideonella oryzae TaxID=2937441 RepID=A0ABT1BGG8_9BURK|nr:BON domain-containing protein [Ideonella oryzae]MCO5975348.1 BON domain-containing protein [Ideonella oryzae]
MMTALHPTALRTLTLAALCAGGLALSACSERDHDKTAGEKVDAAIAQADSKIETAQAQASRELDQARDASAEAAIEVGDKFNRAAKKAASAVDDAAITTAINAKLAQDPQLNVLKVNVDTRNGHVLLKGEAPDEKARARATQLAMQVDGVRGVENQMEVRG